GRSGWQAGRSRRLTRTAFQESPEAAMSRGFSFQNWSVLLRTVLFARERTRMILQPDSVPENVICEAIVEGTAEVAEASTEMIRGTAHIIFCAGSKVLFLGEFPGKAIGRSGTGAASPN